MVGQLRARPGKTGAAIAPDTWSAPAGKSTRMRRYRQIARVLARHGLGYMAGILGLERFLPLRQAIPSRTHAINSHTPPEHLRMALEELGTTFIKLGQILSTRDDLLPPTYIAELSKLQDSAPQVPYEAVRDMLAAELGRPPEEVFANFDPVPLAAASIGQAHAAVLPDGTEVVVKIRRPGVVEQVENDLEILHDLAATANRRWQFAGQYDLPGLAQEFAQTLRAELDYIREAQNAERFSRNFAGDSGIHIPRIYWETTTSRVLTLERIRGIKIDDLSGLDAAGIDRPALARRAADVILKMVFDHGFYHADPHPGNFFIEPGGRIGLIDFGMVGRLDQRTQEQLAEVLLAITSRDADRLVDAFVDMRIAPVGPNRTLLRQDLDHMVSFYYGMELGDIKISKLLNDALEITRSHHLHLPSNLALLIKSMIMNEGLGVQLDPAFNLALYLAPHARWLIIRNYSPVLLARRLGQAGLDTVNLATELPQQVRRIMGEVERGGLEVGMRPQGFDPLLRRFEQLANRIVLGIIAAAFINGLAILLSVYHIPDWEQWVATLFALGFVAAAVLGGYLAWTILRSRRK